MFGPLLIILLALTILGFILGQRKAFSVVGGQRSELHSRPLYHGLYVAAFVGIPTLLLSLVWVFLQGPALDALLLRSLDATTTTDLSLSELSLLMSQIKSVADGIIFGEPSALVVEAAARLNGWQQIANWAMIAVCLAIGLVVLVFTRLKIAKAYRARQRVEKVLDRLMIAASVLAIMTTFGIVVSLTIESMRFFDRVPITEFLFGLNWEPQIPIREGQITAGGAFGAIPVYVGTFLIALIAMLVAVPIGLMAAIYLSEYASRRMRAIVKPLLEILAGIPTVVYGFFAVLVVAPAMRSFGALIGVDIAPNSALAAGGVMGIMLIPFISSFSDDAISAVPRSLREGAYGLGATKSETIIDVLLPAALPGITSGILLAVSRAIGETMIVVMAAGIIATLTLNPLEPVTTVTVQIVTLLIGDSEFDNPKTLAAFALGLTLFLITLALNVFALRIVRKYREQYD